MNSATNIHERPIPTQMSNTVLLIALRIATSPCPSRAKAIDATTSVIEVPIDRGSFTHNVWRNACCRKLRVKNNSTDYQSRWRSTAHLTRNNETMSSKEERPQELVW